MTIYTGGVFGRIIIVIMFPVMIVCDLWDVYLEERCLLETLRRIFKPPRTKGQICCICHCRKKDFRFFGDTLICTDCYCWMTNREKPIILKKKVS